MQWLVYKYILQFLQLLLKKNASIGDSGGALFVGDIDAHCGRTIIGIVSFGSSRGCANGIPDVYTRVSCYLDWIHDTMDKN